MHPSIPTKYIQRVPYTADHRELRTTIGHEGVEFLNIGLLTFTSLLPHTELSDWSLTKHYKLPKNGGKTKVCWESSKRRALRIRLVFRLPSSSPPHLRKRAGSVHVGWSAWFVLTAQLKRMAAPRGVGRVERTLDQREKDLCSRIATRIVRWVRPAGRSLHAESLRAISSSLEENVVAAHLKSRHSLDFEVHDTLLALRQLAEESYENRSLTYGLIIAGDQSAPKGFHRFPRDFLSFKRYRALSDGYRTAFKISQSGHLLGLEELAEGGTTLASGFYPEWGKNLVASLVPGDVGVSLTRQGDVLVFDSGGLRFTYRRGHWQYWNHAHVTDLLRNRTRIQHVAKQNIPPVVRAIYRAALDISFRRSGGLFVLVRAERNLRRLVPRGDAIGDRGRLPQHRDFDRTLRNSKIHALPRAIIAELAALDGAVVINNGGTLLAYGAVLITGGKFGASEGSRTKAASSASQYGLAVKISSDGDIAFYEKDNLFLSI